MPEVPVSQLQKGDPGDDIPLADGAVMQGPWAKDLECGPGNSEWADSGFEPIKMCMHGWEAQLKQHEPYACVAYDIGVRDIADFALAMIEKNGCSVRAYDPSETTAKWYDQDQSAQGFATMNDPNLAKLKEYEKKDMYKLHREAASGSDGDLVLYAYNWQQISTFRASDETKDKQKEFHVKSKTLKTMMEDNGDKYIDVLKIDIEGSEFPFLTEAFDGGKCPPVEHMFLEWHSQNMDYDQAAPPEVLELEKKFKKCGYTKYAHYPFFLGRPTDEEEYDIKRTFYGHAGYCKSCVQPE